MKPSNSSTETCCPIVELRQYTLHPGKRDVLIDLFDREFVEHTIKPETTAAGAAPMAYFVSEHSENTFPALPVRENENVFVWFARFNDPAAYDVYLTALARSERWRETSEELARRVKGTPE